MMLMDSIGGQIIPGMHSTRCHSFDKRADGFARAEGCSSAILHRDNKMIRLCGTAVQQDGRSASLTAPNGMAQAKLLKAVHGVADVAACGLSVLEAHATGTPLGTCVLHPYENTLHCMRVWEWETLTHHCKHVPLLSSQVCPYAAYVVR